MLILFYFLRRVILFSTITYTQTTVEQLPEGRGVDGSRVKWSNIYTVIGVDLTLGGRYTMQYTDEAS